MDDFENLYKYHMTGDKLNPDMTELTDETRKSLEYSLTSIFEKIFGLIPQEETDKKSESCKCDKSCTCKKCQDNTVKNTDICKDAYKDNKVIVNINFDKDFKNIDDIIHKYKNNNLNDIETEVDPGDLRAILLNKYKDTTKEQPIDYKQEIINKVIERLHGEPNIDFKYMDKVSKDDKVTIQVVLSDIPDIAKVYNYIQLLLDIKEQLIKDYKFSDVYINIANKRILYFYIVL